MLAVHHYNEFLEATHSKRFILLMILEGPGQDRMALLLSASGAGSVLWWEFVADHVFCLVI